MTAEELYLLWQKTKSKLFNIPYTHPRNWINIYARKDWPFFEKLAKVISRKKIDPYLFFVSNFVLRNGEFYPSMFMTRQSFINYKAYIHKHYEEYELREKLRRIIKQALFFIKAVKKRGWFDEYLFDLLIEKKKIDDDFISILYSILQERERKMVDLVLQAKDEKYTPLYLLAHFRGIEALFQKRGLGKKIMVVRTILYKVLYERTRF